jgi:hypothetical protein
MKSVLTLTLNPTIDISYGVARMVAGRKVRAASERHDPGGGGINVARVLSRLGTNVRCLYLAGGGTGSARRSEQDEYFARSNGNIGTAQCVNLGFSGLVHLAQALRGKGDAARAGFRYLAVRAHLQKILVCGGCSLPACASCLARTVLDAASRTGIALGQTSHASDGPGPIDAGRLWHRCSQDRR